MANQRLSAETFEELALPLFDQLYNFAHWLTHNAPEAEDLVQETFVKALRGFSGFQLGTNFRAWMFRILRNTFLTSRTGLKSTAMSDDEVDFDQIATAAPNPESVLIAQANRELVRYDLPAAERERWAKLAEPIHEDWVKRMEAKGHKEAREILNSTLAMLKE